MSDDALALLVVVALVFGGVALMAAIADRGWERMRRRQWRAGRGGRL